MKVDACSRGPFVRGMQLRDVAAVHELAVASPGAAQWPLESYKQLLRLPMLCMVLEEQARILGFVAIRTIGEEAEVLNLAVHASERRRGYASSLLRAGEYEAKKSGAETVFLEVRESNAAAIQLYEEYGFTRTGRRPGYYRDPDEAAILMMRKLTELPD